MKAWIESHTNTMLALGCVLGLLVPGMEGLPGFLIFLSVSAMIYFACSRLNMEDLRRISPARTAAFYVFRFLLLPCALYAAVRGAAPRFADAVLLLSLAPAGSAAPALSAMHGGNTTLSMGYTVSSSALAPFAMAAAFALTGGAEVDPWGMMLSLAAAIFLPALFYFTLARRNAAAREWTSRNARVGSVLMLFTMIFLIVGRQRTQLLDMPPFAVPALLVLAIVTAAYYLSGWFFPAADRATRVSQTICSGAMNNGVAIALAAVYFPGPTALVTVLSEVTWISSLALFGWFLKRDNKKPPV